MIEENKKYNGMITCPYADCDALFHHTERKFRVYSRKAKKMFGSENEQGENNSTKQKVEYKDLENENFTHHDTAVKSKNNDYDSDMIKYYYNEAIDDKSKALVEKTDYAKENGEITVQNRLVSIFNSYSIADKENIKVSNAFHDSNLDEDFVVSITDKYGNNSDIPVCPKCGRILPTKAGMYPMIFMPIIGVTNSGKTAYILKLHEALSELNIFRKKGNCPEDYRINDLIDEYKREITRGTEPNKNLKASVNQPICWTVSYDINLENYKAIIVTYNLAGEGFTLEKEAEYRGKIVEPIIKKAHAVMVVVSPNLLEDLSIEAAKRTESKDKKSNIPNISSMLNIMENILKTSNGDSNHKIDILLNITMLDKIEYKYEALFYPESASNQDGNHTDENQKKLIKSIVTASRTIDSIGTSNMVIELIKSASSDGSVEHIKEKYNLAEAFATQVGPPADGLYYLPLGVLKPIDWLLKNMKEKI